MAPILSGTSTSKRRSGDASSAAPSRVLPPTTCRRWRRAVAMPLMSSVGMPAAFSRASSSCVQRAVRSHLISSHVPAGIKYHLIS